MFVTLCRCPLDCTIRKLVSFSRAFLFSHSRAAMINVQDRRLIFYNMPSFTKVCVHSAPSAVQFIATAESAKVTQSLAKRKLQSSRDERSHSRETQPCVLVDSWTLFNCAIRQPQRHKEDEICKRVQLCFLAAVYFLTIATYERDVARYKLIIYLRSPV